MEFFKLFFPVVLHHKFLFSLLRLYPPNGMLNLTAADIGLVCNGRRPFLRRANEISVTERLFFFSSLLFSPIRIREYQSHQLVA